VTAVKASAVMLFLWVVDAVLRSHRQISEGTMSRPEKQFELESWMEDEDERATVPFLHETPVAPPREQGNKCPHGVYIARGDSVALYCTACSPGHGRIFTKQARVPQVTHAERTLDTAEYFEQPLSERLAFAAQLEEAISA